MVKKQKQCNWLATDHQVLDQLKRSLWWSVDFPKTAFNTSKRGFLCPLILYGWRASSCDPNILIFSLVTRHIDVLHKYLEKYVTSQNDVHADLNLYQC